jgi:hypothetical protein
VFKRGRGKSRFMKQNFMSDKKRKTFSPVFFLVLKTSVCFTTRAPISPPALVIKRLFLALEKKVKKSFTFFIEQIVIVAILWFNRWAKSDSKAFGRQLSFAVGREQKDYKTQKKQEFFHKVNGAPDVYAKYGSF